MGLFTSAADKARHRQLLAQAGHLIASVEAEGNDTGSIPFDLRIAIWPRVYEMQKQIRDVEAAEKRLGNAALLKEMHEHIEEVSRLLAGIMAPDVRVRIRTEFFDRVVGFILEPETSVEVLRGQQGRIDILADHVRFVEGALRWFSEPPEPRSVLYTAEQARVGLARARECLEALRR
jgi:hypothetical protein